MNLAELNRQDAGQLQVGDLVLVHGTVVEAHPGVGVLVEFRSKTEDYRGWVALDGVAARVLPDVPDEPEDGAWLVAHNDMPLHGGVNVFHRDDAHAPAGPQRRWPQHWQVAGTGEWIDWPTAYERGARPHRRLHYDGLALDDNLRHLIGPIIGYLQRRDSDARTTGFVARTLRQTGHDVTDDQVQYVLDWLVRRGRIRVMPANPDHAHPRSRYQVVTE